MTSTKPGPIAPYLDVQSVVEAAKPGVLEVEVLKLLEVKLNQKKRIRVTIAILDSDGF